MSKKIGPVAMSSLLSSEAESPKRDSIYIVCSPRRRVGKTLIARLLTEYKLLQGAEVLAFDVDPSDESLVAYLPERTILSSIGSVDGQIALYDRILKSDGSKVIDLSIAAFNPFFNMAHRFGFIEEAMRVNLDPVGIYVTDGSNECEEKFASLLRAFPSVVAVFNDLHLSGCRSSSIFERAGNVTVPLRISRLPPGWNEIVEAAGFSFSSFLHNPSGPPEELYYWLDKNFSEFSRLEKVLSLRKTWKLLMKPGDTELTVSAASQVSEFDLPPL